MTEIPRYFRRMCDFMTRRNQKRRQPCTINIPLSFLEWNVNECVVYMFFIGFNPIPFNVVRIMYCGGSSFTISTSIYSR